MRRKAPLTAWGRLDCPVCEGTRVLLERTDEIEEHPGIVLRFRPCRLVFVTCGDCGNVRFSPRVNIIGQLIRDVRSLPCSAAEKEAAVAEIRRMGRALAGVTLH